MRLAAVLAAIAILVAACGNDDASVEGRHSEELGITAYGDWRLIEDDGTIYFAHQVLRERPGELATLTVRCRPTDPESPLDVYVKFPGGQFATPPGALVALTEVFYTIGDISTSGLWAINQDTLFSGNAELMAQLIAFIDTDTITIATTTEDGRVLEHTFSLHGAREAVTLATEACDLGARKPEGAIPPA